MKTIKYLSYIVLGTFVLSLTSCEPRSLNEEDVFVQDQSLEKILQEENPVHGYKIYTLNEFTDAFMTEAGNFASDTTPYRYRSYDATHQLYLYSVDTIKTDTLGIYIRGRIATDDYAGNFYKSVVIQQVVNDEQQTLRISVDLGSSGGMYQIGQEILIRCNGLSIGRYANQPQLCVPSYNNNIYAMTASEKVGWCPGRIPSAVFRRATRMIGTPEPSKLKYDELTLTELYNKIPLKATADAAGMDKVRKADGHLVRIKDVHFTGEYKADTTKAPYYKFKPCVTLHPDSSENANVFAPTTKNIGYPQGRVLVSGSQFLLCSNSEYAKFAYFYLPGADRQGIEHCAEWEGSVTGILGWYLDKASKMANNEITGCEWSVTPRGIPGIGVEDIQMKHKTTGEAWVPQEYNPKDYE